MTNHKEFLNQLVEENRMQTECKHQDVYVSKILKYDSPINLFEVELICRECGGRLKGTAQEVGKPAVGAK